MNAMQLPDLAPDICFDPLRQTEEDFAFSFAVKRAALGPYIIQRWGWNENEQRRLHRDRLSTKLVFVIQRGKHRIGTISLMRVEDYLRFGEFYLWPDEQGSGLGTRILEHCLAFADNQGLAVRLEYLKWNPVGRLYQRHGFSITGESDIHWFAERPVAGKPDIRR
jgi:GNAT superfamily N-acetyltransferase